MEIYNNTQDNFISVWLTKDERQSINRSDLTKAILARHKSKKLKVVFYLSGNDNLVECTAGLLKQNIRQPAGKPPLAS